MEARCSWSSTAHQWTPLGKWPLIIHEFQIKSPLFKREMIIFKRKVITLKEVHNLIVSAERNLICARTWASPKEENIKLQWCAYEEGAMLMIPNVLYRGITVWLSIIISFWQDIFFFSWMKILVQLLPRKEKGTSLAGWAAVLHYNLFHSLLLKLFYFWPFQDICELSLIPNAVLSW